MLLVFPSQKGLVLVFSRKSRRTQGPLLPIHPRISPILPIDSAIEPYFIACTVQANGATPTAHMWMGVGGSVADKLAGISRTSTGGTPAQTPNVVAAPLTLGNDPGQSASANAS